MARKCPSGAECPSQRCRFHLAGKECVLDIGEEHTLVEIAITLRISPSHARRIEARALANYFAKLAEIESSSVESPFSSRIRRESPNVTSVAECAPHVVNSDIASDSCTEGRRAGRIPRRWSKP
jgi:hypothetical protein